MLRLPKLEVREPSTLSEACDLLAEHGDRARMMAGGTDLIPNMKHEIVTPEIIVGLWRIPELKGVRVDAATNTLRLGATNTLHALANDPLLQKHVPSLAEACAQVAGPQLRRMGTIGGNICLDTRCVYINQTYFWRSALGFCIKKDGSKCHVVAGGRRCVAAASNDSAPVLMTLGATLIIAGARGTREVSIDDFYTTDGVFNQARTHQEIVAEVRIPIPKANTISAYTKLRTRAAIDFPELGVAVLARLDAHRRTEWADVCVTALGARPVHVKNLEPAYKDRLFDDATIEAIAEAAYQRCKPLTNIASDPSYRREMVRVFVRRAFRRARERAAS